MGTKLQIIGDGTFVMPELVTEKRKSNRKSVEFWTCDFDTMFNSFRVEAVFNADKSSVRLSLLSDDRQYEFVKTVYCRWDEKYKQSVWEMFKDDVTTYLNSPVLQ